MTKEEIEKILENVKPAYAPFGCQLNLVGLEGDEIKLKLTCSTPDTFKVQGKIVKVEDEIKKEISSRVEASVKGAKVSFV